MSDVSDVDVSDSPFGLQFGDICRVGKRRRAGRYLEDGRGYYVDEGVLSNYGRIFEAYPARGDEDPRTLPSFADLEIVRDMLREIKRETQREAAQAQREPDIKLCPGA